MNYFDHAATTPMRPEVLEAMTPYFLEQYGNPSSIHGVGRKARAALDASRRTLATWIGATPNEIVFTSGGTESDNYALFGAAYANRHKGKHVITTKVEHHAVLHAMGQLEREGFDVTYLDVDESGAVSVAAFKDALRDDTILVSVMYGNNEVGTLQPIADIGMLLAGRDTLFHTDAVQVLGTEAIDVHALGVDLLSASAHKVNGPKGIGFLFIKTGVKLATRSFGGQQERKRRAGTENVPGAVGFSRAAELVIAERNERVTAYREMADTLLHTLDELGVEYEVNGANRLPHIVNLYLPGIELEPFLIMMDMRGYAISSGSACTAGTIEPSHVLTAMYGQSDRTKQSVRISFGLGNTVDDVTRLAERLHEVVSTFMNGVR
ncbi:MULTISPECIES: cysteine desulfurase family protein [unclassified Exiguobacterium]|uniref:cysteine desulfurase family protein n=1 Tax=unclassified Exiguobacterium TaxID=2644629 RepID=UPI00103ACDEA|nr:MULTISPECIES: cysteine desulfurase family protein [unclassified Exiguobacterium]TCI45864.1 cysteine desulfurase [Exiguobacterium sp. SH5S32]TCI51621.1 cysteine desulfurase [Exiguobacterium sp. SH1S4]TCI65637.1 cysteine desulfurase [Exiguobacterium sp. SH0S2]TCI71607.1 cysteine desulfurase [Exiguobacterium sp. SH1S1]